MANSPFFPMEDLFGEEFTPVAPVRTSAHSCDTCGRYQHCKSPKFPVYGEGAKGILIVSEFPSASDDASGIPLSGDSGAILHRELRRLGLDLKRDCWTVFALRCYTKNDWDGENGKQGDKERTDAGKACYPKLHETISQLSPTCIIPLGPIAIQALLGQRLGGRMSGTQPTSFIGHQIPDQDLQAWVCPTSGLKHLLTYEKKQDIQKFFKLQLEAGIRKVGIPVPKAFSTDDVTIFHGAKEYVELLKTIKPGMDIAFDYETTGLKPQRHGHEIVYASVAFGPENHVKGFAGYFHKDDPDFMREWRRILTDPNIGKVAHQNQFEDTWTFVRGGGFWVRGWIGDTCLGAHVLNNNDPTSLKFLVYTNFGIMGYDHEVDKYLKANDETEGANSFNRIYDAPPEKMMAYNGMDSIGSLECFYKQRHKLLEYKPQLRGNRFLLEASPELARASEIGIQLDVSMMQESRKRIAVDMDTTLKRIQSYPEVSSTFNPNAPEQISKLFYDTLKMPMGRSGRVADEAALQSFHSPIANDILEWKKMSKLSGTYLDGFMRESESGTIHTSFRIDNVTTFRSSSSNPNFQNVPKRDKVAKKMIRSALKPRPGHVLIELDYKAVEVSVGYCNHLDKNMGAYLRDPHSDMHSDIGSKIFMMSRDDVKPYRSDAKFLATFAEFYGSKAEAFGRQKHGEVTLKMWDYLQVHPELLDHMRTNGAGTLDKLQEHLVAWEKDLWTNMFPGYAQWKRDIWRFYQEHLYVEQKTGFRCWGPLGFNDATNYPIQGPAFHCLLWTMKNTAPLIRDIAGESEAAVCGQIHDALVVDARPDLVPQVAEIVQEWGTRKLVQHWKWLDTPMTIEMEGSEIDGHWADMKPLHERDYWPK